jgi:RNA polymerase sigma factor (TIGR02999 family)
VKAIACAQFVFGVEPGKSSHYDPPNDRRGWVNSDITGLLGKLREGESGAADALLPLIYADFRRLAAAKMARQQPGHTLQATALVHEAWMRLVDSEGRARFENRAHFFGAAAEAMRRILVDHARRKNREKRGGGAGHCDVDEVEIAAPNGSRDELLAVHEALDRLAAHDARRAELVKLRYFVGLSFEEAAEVLGISVPTANRDWAYARAWLHAEITAEGQRKVARE